MFDRLRNRRIRTDRELRVMAERRADKAESDFLSLLQTYSGLKSASELVVVALAEARAEQCKCGGHAHD